MKLRYLLPFALLAVGLPLHAQNRTAFAGERNAIDYAYGTVRAAPPPLLVGNTVAAGTNVTLTVQFGNTTAGDGIVFAPLATNALITIGIGAGQDTVTPSAVSCQTPAVYNSCTITVTTTYAHGVNDPIASATFGLQEAINLTNAGGGGPVAISQGWTQAGGTAATIALTVPFSNVWIHDNRGTVGAPYWTMQPSTLTVIPNTVAFASSTIVFAATPVGTWAASAYYFCYTYVDALGGESTCSPTYNQTPTVNYSLTATAPAATAGAVGWRMYAGASYALAYLLPITSTQCTLTTLETVVPACAIGSNGVWLAPQLTTTALAPLALGATNTSQPVPQSHTTFAYQPSGISGYPFQTHYGPFGSGTIASCTAGDSCVLGSLNLPAGFLNTIGRTIRFTGKIVGGATATGTMVINVGAVWAGGVTAGAPVAVCIDTTTSVLGTQNYTIPFSCTWTTNAVGATAVGSVQADSWLIAAGPSTTNIVGSDTGAAAVGSLGLFSQDQVYFYLTPGTEAFTAARLMDLHVEVLQ